MREWDKYTADTVRTAKDENGGRLILEFAQDYQQKYGHEMDSKNISCPKCFRATFQKFLNQTTMAEAKDFQLKPMYNGLTLGHGSQVVISNKNITVELAIKFIKEHKRGKDLFAKLPANIDELIAKETEVQAEVVKPKKKPRKRTPKAKQ